MELVDLVNSVIIFLSQTTLYVWFPNQIPDCNSHSPALFDLFITSAPSICSTVVFPILGNSYHFVISASIDFPSNSKGDIHFHGTPYDYSRADWDGLPDHLRDVPWENIFRLSDLDCCYWILLVDPGYIWCIYPAL